MYFVLHLYSAPTVTFPISLLQCILFCVLGSVDTDRGSQLYSDLCEAREALCVANYLHLLYLVTPYDLVDQVRPSWMTYLDQVRIMVVKSLYKDNNLLDKMLF